MATERQIKANRTNALKSTGPITPEGKRISSKNAALPGLFSGTVVLKGESRRRFNDLAAALFLQFQPRNSAEAFLIQTMTAARWRLLRMWGIQTAGFELEMAKTREESGPAAGSGAVLAAVTFRSLADNSRALALQHRFEAAYDRQYNRALTTLLKLRESPASSMNPSLDSGAPSHPPIRLTTETWDDDFSDEADSEAASDQES
jgi:hypothetical protein